jgi:hypothetical protein
MTTENITHEKKSITRRVIAIAFSLTGAGVMAYLSLTGSESAFTALVATTSSVVSFYFGTKANTV